MSLPWASVEVFSSVERQTSWDCVKLKSLRGRAWMIYAFVISHLLKQGVNVFVPLHQSSLQRRRGKDGANALEENSKVNRAICPGAPVFSSILSWRCNGCRQSPCDSFVNPLCPSTVISQCCTLSKWEDSKCDRCFWRNNLSCFWQYPLRDINCLNPLWLWLELRRINW